MSHASRAKVVLVLTVVAIATFGVAAQAQQPRYPKPTELPNPYRLVEGWPTLPKSMNGGRWGEVIRVHVHSDGNIWVFQRCFNTVPPGHATCIGRGASNPPILEFDPSGMLLKSFGAGLFAYPHGFTVDRDGNLWVTDVNDQETILGMSAKNAEGVVFSNKVFPHFVLTVMPVGLRGLVVAGVLATTMGSLSTALNSLATSYVRDFHFRWFGEPVDDKGKVKVLRFGTVLFAVLLITVALATAWVSAHNPKLRILPIILGIFGYTYGSLLGIFMVGLFTKTRGSDRGNGLAMLMGFLVVAYLSGLDSDVCRLFGGSGLARPEWMPTIEFPWRILFGTVVTFLVAVSFRTPKNVSRA